jgi:transposase-like protein
MNHANKNRCIFCGGEHLYHVSTTQYRCAVCQKTWSHRKIKHAQRILDAFLDDLSVQKASQSLTLNYATVAKRYETFRSLLIQESEKRYYDVASFQEYDEYYFLPSSKKGDAEHLFEAIGILGMLYNEKVHTLLLPNHFEHLKQSLEENDKSSYATFLHRHKVAKLQSFDSPLTLFWHFLEQFLHRFKGITKKNFIYYLKEAEFKFNYDKKEQRLLLETLLKEHSYM